MNYDNETVYFVYQLDTRVSTLPYFVCLRQHLISLSDPLTLKWSGSVVFSKSCAWSKFRLVVISTVHEWKIQKADFRVSHDGRMIKLNRTVINFRPCKKMSENMAIRCGCCVIARTRNDVYAIWQTVQDRPLTSSALSKIRYAQKVKKNVYCISTCIWQTVVTFGNTYHILADWYPDENCQT